MSRPFKPYINHFLTDEFARAVKICTGSPLNEHLIDTVFAIFDEDGDGKNFNTRLIHLIYVIDEVELNNIFFPGLLSYKEFIAIMRVS